MSSPHQTKGKGRVGAVLFHLAALPGDSPEAKPGAWGANPSGVTHNGVICKGPQCINRSDYIQGTRYKCTKCPNFDFCDVCIRDPASGHSRDHEFWPCDGESVFEDWENMSRGELHELQNTVGDIPEEYVVLPQRGRTIGAAEAQKPEALNLDQLGVELFGVNNHVAQDQLPTHWKNGIPAVRLIDLLPGESDETLSCLLSSTRLDKPEQYDALCCDWTPGDGNVGLIPDPNEPPSVICVGEQFREIKKSTADALRAIRSTSDITKVWIEELCMSEREEFRIFQHRSISLIYDRAERTIVWTGLENADTEAACTLIEILSHRCESEDEVLPSPSDLEDDPDLEELDLLPVGADQWLSLTNFYPPHLFIQGWLLHDAAFASKPVVKCGQYELEWWQVARVRDMLAQPSWMKLDWRRR